MATERTLVNSGKKRMRHPPGKVLVVLPNLDDNKVKALRASVYSTSMWIALILLASSIGPDLYPMLMMLLEGTKTTMKMLELHGDIIGN